MYHLVYQLVILLCIYGSCMILTVDSDYFLKQLQLLDLCNSEVWCSIWGTDWIIKYYLDELRLQRAIKRTVSIWNIL
jgi:hypothetical protein